MELWGVIAVLAAVILIQGILYWKYQRQMKDICRQLAFLRKHESNMVITREIEYGGIKELTDQLNELLADSRKERKAYLEKEKMISDTYTNLSHDIRTPLTSMDGYFQLLEESDSREEQQRYMKIIQERIGSLKDMLEELFLFTKLKNDSYHLELERCCINQIVKKTVFSYYDEWTRQGIVPEIQIEEQNLYIEGNQQAVQRMLCNIIKNALDHGNGEIEIRLSKDESFARLCVANLIDDAEEIDVNRVFERFYKADAARSTTSSGLGLSIAREFANRMNGEIQASLEGKKFAIEMCFPLCKIQSNK